MFQMDGPAYGCEFDSCMATCLRFTNRNCDPGFGINPVYEHRCYYIGEQESAWMGGSMGNSTEMWCGESGWQAAKPNPGTDPAGGGSGSGGGFNPDDIQPIEELSVGKACEEAEEGDAEGIYSCKITPSITRKVPKSISILTVLTLSSVAK